MPTPTDERRDLLTDAHLNAPHLQHFSATMGDLLDDDGLTITRLRRIA